MTARTDTHRPSIADPAEYAEVGYVDQHPEDGGAWWAAGYPGDHDFFHGHYEERGGCDHCGQHGLRYVVFFEHEPTGEIIAVGETCAAKLALPSIERANAKREVERQARERTAQTWLDANPEAAEFLTTECEAERGDWPKGGFWGSRWAIATDMRAKLRRYGSLSEKQVAFLLKIRDSLAERRTEDVEREANEPESNPIPDELLDGRHEFSGEIVGLKTVEGYMGGVALKKVFRDDRGFKLWGTVPERLLDDANEALCRFPDGHAEVLRDHDLWTRPMDVEIIRGRQSDKGGIRGQRIAFSAAIERADDDETFGFFKRPTKARFTENLESDTKE